MGKINKWAGDSKTDLWYLASTVPKSFTIYAPPYGARHAGSLLQTWLNPSMDDKHHIVWDEITYPFPNFNGFTVEVCERISWPHEPCYQGSFWPLSQLWLDVIWKVGSGSIVCFTWVDFFVWRMYQSYDQVRRKIFPHSLLFWFGYKLTLKMAQVGTFKSNGIKIRIWRKFQR